MPTDLQKPTRATEAIFQIKASLLTMQRHLHNAAISPKRFSFASRRHANDSLLATSISPLWNTSDTDQNRILTAGKVQNLRIAAKQLHGIEVPANTLFSFWAHIGRPHVGKGYVLGREIREGCLVPTIAGGLCQLSNALYDAALQAECAIIERHRHSQVIPGSFAEHDRDATVKWNYIDLRFIASHAFRIEVVLTAENLLVHFKGASQKRSVVDRTTTARRSSMLNDCYVCGNQTCAKHLRSNEKPTVGGITTYLLDEQWPEYNAYVTATATKHDALIVPSTSEARWPIRRYSWNVARHQKVIQLSRQAWIRALRLRLRKASDANIFSAMLHLDKPMAMAAAKRIPWESTHVVVPQNLLPFLWDAGVLGGRTFDVMMTRLPLERLHQRLDSAYDKYPESRTLHDFRAPQELVDLENSALTSARRVITPHQDIAAMFAHKVLPLPWSVPGASRQERRSGTQILFPGSTLGRKGAYEMRRVARELHLPLVVMGELHEDPNFWDGVSMTMATGDPLEGVHAVVYPPYVEHQPRILLRALANGIRVVATSACGLSPADNLTIVPTGDYEALRAAVASVLRVTESRPASQQSVATTLFAPYDTPGGT